MRHGNGTRGIYFMSAALTISRGAGIYFPSAFHAPRQSNCILIYTPSMLSPMCMYLSPRVCRCGTYSSPIHCQEYIRDVNCPHASPRILLHFSRFRLWRDQRGSIFPLGPRGCRVCVTTMSRLFPRNDDDENESSTTRLNRLPCN